VPLCAQSSSNTFSIIMAVAIIAVLAIRGFYLMPYRRTGREPMGDATEVTPKEIDYPADKIGDKSPAEDVKDNVKPAVN
jgi:hypothetical protein